MKKILLLFLVVSALKTSAQKIIKTEQVTDHSIHVIGDTFEGIIFKAEFQAQYPKFENDTSKSVWFTPTIDQIILVEIIIGKQLKNIDRKAKYPNGKYIFKHLSDFHRQYVGYVNSKGEEIVYINCFPVDEDWANEKATNGKKKLNIPKWYDNMFEVFDGGPSFWHAEVNLRTKKIVTFYVNGVA